MKKSICILLAAILLLGLCACGAKPAEEVKEWTRAGYFSDENEDMLSITWMDDIDEPGWYVGVMLGELWGGCTLPQEGNTLHGDLNAWDESAEPFVVTISEEGEDGLLLEIEGGESYHFTPAEMQEATIFVSINTEGWGNIAYAEGEEAPEIDPEYPFQSAQINLAEPATHTFVAWPNDGWRFVKWTKDGADYSTDAQITVELDESADFVAVFEEGSDDPNDDNPETAESTKQREGFDGLWVEEIAGRCQIEFTYRGEGSVNVDISWSGSAFERARWEMTADVYRDDIMIYEDGHSWIETYTDDDNFTVSEETFAGTGSFYMQDGKLHWVNDQTGEDTVFIPA